MESYIKGLNDEFNICAKEFEEFKKYLDSKLYDAGLNNDSSINILATNKIGCFNYFDSRRNDSKFHNLNIFFEKKDFAIRAKISFIKDLNDKQNNSKI